MSEQSSQSLGDKAKHEVVWTLMTQLGIGHITVSFNGEGDSGDITDIEAYPIERQPTNTYPPSDAQRQEWAGWSTQGGILNGAMRTTPTGIVEDIYAEVFVSREHVHAASDLTLIQLVRLLTEPIVNGLSEDWVNNDGGYGTVTWDATEQTILVEVSIRVVSTEDTSYEYDKYGQLED